MDYKHIILEIRTNYTTYIGKRRLSFIFFLLDRHRKDDISVSCCEIIFKFTVSL